MNKKEPFYVPEIEIFLWERVDIITASKTNSDPDQGEWDENT